MRRYSLEMTSKSIDWKSFQIEAQSIADREILLSQFISDVILSQDSFESSMAALLSTCFTGMISTSTWQDIFKSAFVFNVDGDNACKSCQCCSIYDGEQYVNILIKDLLAIQNRDPACQSIVNAYLYFKGFKALQTHRAAHILWSAGRKDVALAIQSRCSELWSLDIHPAAHIGAGLMIDHGTGVVIGETAVVGTNCSFLHGVTLGSTGKESGDRHPKIGDDVLIGCNAMVLGRITIGRSAKIGSGSVVIKSIPANATAVGNPARIIGRSAETTTAAAEMDLALNNVVSSCGAFYRNTWALWADGSLAFDDVDSEGKGFVDKTDIKRILIHKYQHDISDTCINVLFSKLGVDTHASGRISRERFEVMMETLRPVFQEDQLPPPSTTTSSQANLELNSNTSDHHEVDYLNLLRGEGSIDEVLINYFSKISETIPCGGHAI